MKILHICPDYFPFSKGAMSFKLLSEYWCNEGHTVTVISSTTKIKREKGINISHGKTYFFTLFKLPSRFSEGEYYSPIKYRDRLILKHFCKYELSGYDVIFVEGFLEGLPRLFLKYLNKFGLRKKAVFINHGLPEASYDKLLSKLSSLSHKSIGKILAEGVEKFVVYSDYTKMQLRQILRVPETKIFKIKLGIDVDTFLKYAYLNTKSENSIFNNVEADYILAIGRYDKIKGYEILLKSFSKLVKEFDNLKLIIAGAETGYTNLLKNIASELGIKQWVIFLGRISEEDKIKLMINCKVFVVPSLREGYGLNVIEASILGLKIVATDVGAHSEILQVYNNKILVEANSVDGLYDGIFKMLNSKGQNIDISEDYAERYDIKKTGQELLSLALNLRG